MKKLFAFLRSMRFGLTLMLGIIFLSVIGSILPQNEAESVYAATYPSAYHLIMALGLDHIFSSWYFLALMGLLCLNLTLCSLTRAGRVRQLSATVYDRVATLPNACQTTRVQYERLIALLRRRRYHEKQTVGAIVFDSNRLGYWGSFATHLAILLVIVLGAAALYTARTNDYTVLPGASVTLEDGTVFGVREFHITDDEGRLDYRSVIEVVSPDGTKDVPAEIRVNEPYGFGSHKFYQQTYGTVGSVTVTNESTGGSDLLTLDEVSFLTADGKDGVWYESLYADYTKNMDGSYTLIASTAGEYRNPVYQVLLSVGGVQTPVLAFPGETLTVGGLRYTFNAPISYPGIRVKTTSQTLLGCLYASFAFLVAGLWLCFFHAPVAVVIREDGFAVSGAKSTDTLILLEAELGELEPATVKEQTKC